MSEKSRIWLDPFGCDDPEAVLRGAAAAARELTDAELVLTGQESEIRRVFDACGTDAGLVEIVPAGEVITNSDKPTEAVMKKRDSSMIRAMTGLRADPRGIGLVTAGSTGAALAGSAAFLGRLPGVVFPALASYLPTAGEEMSVLVDCGANVDCRPEALGPFALLGRALAESSGKTDPKVALVSVGTEEGKGNAFAKAAYGVLKETPVNFVGNMEARDALSGRYDVLVCDGFTGNVLLKAVEGGALFTIRLVMESIARETPPDADAAFVKKAMGRVFAKMDMQSRGGAMILGVGRPVVKMHGSANEKTVPAAIRQLITLANGGFAARAEALLNGKR